MYDKEVQLNKRDGLLLNFVGIKHVKDGFYWTGEELANPETLPGVAVTWCDTLEDYYDADKVASGVWHENGWLILRDRDVYISVPIEDVGFPLGLHKRIEEEVGKYIEEVSNGKQ